MSANLLLPQWPAPRNVRALATTREGGVSEPPYASFNLAMHVGDDPRRVAANRALLRQHLPEEPLWLDQVHGTAVARPGAAASGAPADASCARGVGEVCVVMSADCLPVLFCDRGGSVVAAAHAGWRGLCAGVLEATVHAMDVPPAEVLAWLGPAIGPDAFEVGAEVRTAFIAAQPSAASAFRAGSAPGKWLADLYRLAQLRLQAAGVGGIYGGDWCTHGEPDRFFSFRRDGVTGRQAAMIWIGTQA